MGEVHPCCLCILCILIPPIAVYLKKGNRCCAAVWCNLALCYLLYIPGVIHAIVICYCKP
ncbi:hypothetical protein CRE_11494 [Caenorhabditis remanei]|uniref:Uncharacterized protein n=1 Tax=Caenorhabditis remanei TaxID=31234 RepID=E3NH33_CAERE|nr:hypothetical protein CRE_11494 [Caenorhabditis remanei]